MHDILFPQKKKILALDNLVSSAMLLAIMFFFYGQERPLGDQQVIARIRSSTVVRIMGVNCGAYIKSCTQKFQYPSVVVIVCNLAPAIVFHRRNSACNSNTPKEVRSSFSNLRNTAAF
jgi:hypothetical protein